MYVKQIWLILWHNLYIFRKKSHSEFFPPKSSHMQNVAKKSCELGFHKQFHSLKFQKVGRYVKMAVSTFESISIHL